MSGVRLDRSSRKGRVAFEAKFHRWSRSKQRIGRPRSGDRTDLERRGDRTVEGRRRKGEKRRKGTEKLILSYERHTNGVSFLRDFWGGVFFWGGGAGFILEGAAPPHHLDGPSRRKRCELLVLNCHVLENPWHPCGVVGGAHM